MSIEIPFKNTLLVDYVLFAKIAQIAMMIYL